MNERVVRVERVLPASPEVVFDAWTDPASLQVWMAPDAASVASAECDARVGGAFRIVMIDQSGAMEHTGRYLELDRPHRLVFTWRSLGTGWVDTQVTVELAAIPSGTRMVITHGGLETPDARDSHRRGWTGIADKLVTVVQRG
jgi:uncharacterized protein YndB with AHSA1/START domain